MELQRFSPDARDCPKCGLSMKRRILVSKELAWWNLPPPMAACMLRDPETGREHLHVQCSCGFHIEMRCKDDKGG